VQKSEFEKHKKAFFGIGNEKGGPRPKPPQNEEDAMKVFYGIED